MLLFFFFFCLFTCLEHCKCNFDFSRCAKISFVISNTFHGAGSVSFSLSASTLAITKITTFFQWNGNVRKIFFLFVHVSGFNQMIEPQRLKSHFKNYFGFTNFQSLFSWILKIQFFFFNLELILLNGFFKIVFSFSFWFSHSIIEWEFC